MFVKKKRNRSGSTSAVVAETIKGYYCELVTIGVSPDVLTVDNLVRQGAGVD